MTDVDLTLATNNGDVGGGEVMLLAIAEAARSFGLRVRVVAPTGPGDLADEAEDLGLDTVRLRAHDRRSWMRSLRHWDRTSRSGLLWCNGLVPAVATAGRPDRVVHLHQEPQGPHHRALLALASWRARRVVVPSAFVRATVPRATVLPNWTDDLDQVPLPEPGDPVRVGFLGRMTLEKGVDVLADAVAGLDRPVRLVLGGEVRFETEEDAQVVGAALDHLGPVVERLGWVERATFFGQVDVAVFPSRATESFGLVAAEAMAAGVPFVVSDAGALPEVVGPDHPWVARAGDVPDLARAIRAVLAAPREERARTVARGRARWARDFSPAAGTERLSTLMRDLGLPVTGPVAAR